jgi:hypothetical protein
MHVPVWLHLKKGQQVHHQIIESGLETYVFVESNLVDI